MLAGDALIVLAFQTLADGTAARPERLAALLRIVARATGTPFGIAAGQAWECEPSADPEAYQQSKTGALFAAATLAGAAAAGVEAEPWRHFGERLGTPTRSPTTSATCRRTPVRWQAGRDDGRLGRPNAALLLGVTGALNGSTRSPPMPRAGTGLSGAGRVARIDDAGGAPVAAEGPVPAAPC